MKNSLKNGQEIFFGHFSYRVLENSIWKNGELLEILDFEPGGWIRHVDTMDEKKEDII